MFFSKLFRWFFYKLLENWIIRQLFYFMPYCYHWEDFHHQPPANICKASTWHTERERAVAFVAVLAIWGGGCSWSQDSKTVFIFLYTYSSEEREIDTYTECCIGIVCFVAVYALIGLCLLYRPVYLIWHLHCTPQNISLVICILGEWIHIYYILTFTHT